MVADLAWRNDGSGYHVVHAEEARSGTPGWINLVLIELA